jgi:Uma2 family endonuclease
VRPSLKSELYDGEMIAIGEHGILHSRLKSNLTGEIGLRLKNGPCQSFTGDLKVYVERTGNFFYPDLVVCGTVEVHDGQKDVVVNPTLLIEVLSPSTESFDRGMKFLNYQRIPTLREYLIVAQDRPLLWRYVRQDDNGWLLTTFEDLNGTIKLKSVPVTLALVNIYDRIEFAGETPKLK